jgi:hypothetical protein
MSLKETTRGIDANGRAGKEGKLKNFLWGWYVELAIKLCSGLTLPNCSRQERKMHVERAKKRCDGRSMRLEDREQSERINRFSSHANSVFASHVNCDMFFVTAIRIFAAAMVTDSGDCCICVNARSGNLTAKSQGNAIGTAEVTVTRQVMKRAAEKRLQLTASLRKPLLISG